MTSQPSDARVSVVVPTQNGGPMLIHSLEALDAGRPEIDLIIVDNASSDGSVEKAAELFPQARFVANEVNCGFARACNQGASIASGDFLLFLNNDALIDEENLETLLRAAQSDADGAIWQPVNLRPNGEVEFSGDMFTWWGFFLHLQDRPSGHRLRTVFATKAACLLVRRAVFGHLGGFEDDYFAYFEEADLCWRARMAGWEVRVVPEATVDHAGGMTAVRVLSPAQIRFLSFRNRIRTILANASALSLTKIVPAHLAGCVGFAALFLVTGRLRSFGAVVSAVFWPVVNVSAVWSQRRRAQSIRRLPDSNVLRPDLIRRVTLSTVSRHLKQQVYRWERIGDAAREKLVGHGDLGSPHSFDSDSLPGPGLLPGGSDR